MPFSYWSVYTILTLEAVPSFNLRSPSNKRFLWWLVAHPGIGAVKSSRQWAWTNFSKSSSLVSWKRKPGKWYIVLKKVKDISVFFSSEEFSSSSTSLGKIFQFHIRYIECKYDYYSDHARIKSNKNFHIKRKTFSKCFFSYRYLVADVSLSNSIFLLA